MNNKIALITGGSRGLGKNAALKLAKNGVDIILTYQSQSADAESVVSEIKALGRKAIAVQLDVGKISSLKAFASAVKDILKTEFQAESFDYLLNNAGMGIHASFMDTTEEQFDQLMNVHFKGVFFLTQALAPLIADHGRILNVSTGLTRFALPGYVAYASMKGAIEVLTKYLAKELGLRNIAVNAIAPGAIATDFGGGAVRDNPQLNAFIASQTALGRVGEADDIGDAIASLLSSDSRWINAQRIEASGGMFL